DQVGRKGVPVLLSTGMATLDEARDAVVVLRAAGATKLALFHCVSSYPAAGEDCNLRAIATLRDELRAPVGFSDHTLGIAAAVAAVAAGARLLEKHLTLDKTMSGPDHRASLEPQEMRALVDGIRRVERWLGDGTKAPRPAELDVRAVARRSLHWKRGLPSG